MFLFSKLICATILLLTRICFISHPPPLALSLPPSFPLSNFSSLRLCLHLILSLPLSVALSLCLSLPLCRSFSLSVSLSFSLSLSVTLSIYLSLSVALSLSFPLSLSFFLSVALSLTLPLRRSLSLSAALSISVALSHSSSPILSLPLHPSPSTSFLFLYLQKNHLSVFDRTKFSVFRGINIIIHCLFESYRARRAIIRFSHKQLPWHRISKKKKQQDRVHLLPLYLVAGVPRRSHRPCPHLTQLTMS